MFDKHEVILSSTEAQEIEMKIPVKDHFTPTMAQNWIICLMQRALLIHINRIVSW